MRNLILLISTMLVCACGLVEKKNEEKPQVFEYEIINETEIACVGGKLQTEDGETLIGAKVSLLNQYLLKGETVTDINGNYEICIEEEGKYVLRVSYIGYESQDIQLELIKGKRLVFNDEIVLQEQQIRLEKPVIYLYPKETTKVHVEIDVKGPITHSYPKYKDAWEVEAHPNGTLIDANGRSYYALFWEADAYSNLDMPDGNVVARKDLVDFFEKSLSTLGLNEREANEFIMYWLPRLEEAPYNLIHFSTDDYASKVKLNVSPKPDQQIRIMMLYKPLEFRLESQSQKLTKIVRSTDSFVLVEWGGVEMR